MLGLDATYGYGGSRGKQQQAQSSEEEHQCGDDAAASASKHVSQRQSLYPWRRTKWTDGMVRHLICVVHSIGEDAAAGDCGEQQQKGKKAAGMQQQQKGKWKTVSRAMMEKGFYVSPQQCEDKFNDLNKRFKRVNELVGKDAACVAVDNPTLLDSLVDGLPGKAVEEARKLLSSKHLFFREMCAYHNTSPVSAATAAAGPSFPKEEKEDGHQHDHHYDIVEDEEEEEEDYNDESDEKDEDGRGILDLAGKGQWAKRKGDGMSPAALSPLLSLSSLSGSSATPVQQLKSEMMGLQGEQKQRIWLRMKAAELEEQRVVYQNRALELERLRFKWLRFCSGKEREMELTRLQNERSLLQNDRMLLLLRQKELALVDPAANAGEVNRRENL
ncbi:hypothetical protein KSP40_PGU016356 [Platanthera guangdongensis]|uniref:Myb/SANT-like DNA-binding domain-containing protein n=1 Tax=Platanthera guangdongensis TaxID=2320717 RepID=A0ABR2N0N8_9ASPA